eukprot:CAMPEP_0114475252 /NCGR_PEP_ID=MMETSP0104-20121206/14035_1 /TAXON_ID=37642 ORGANISM="Paraphysomonas imperforata, Strain PA2" /NCGR_SAMPLE_ID=MMETSP0104 /ASSEMBLY_ACC=CAM_ASM_000202 /LENGTH=182 /DNA_ID=CAMNT_0001649729 /DNA_START=70 /DNA_END=614 /DNA_ORIENTATION=+
MGVKDLWQLLSPTGRRVSIETLAGKTLAIDASIWITQFIKAMRDESGKVMKNAHIIGTLRRILKLMFNKIKPVFVFDGATPMLKVQTVRNRRKLRERQEVNLRKQAERILMGRLKQHAIQEHQKKLDAEAEAKKKLTGRDDDSNLARGDTQGIQTSAKVVPVYRPATVLDGLSEGEDEDAGV